MTFVLSSQGIVGFNYGICGCVSMDRSWWNGIALLEWLCANE